MLDNSLTDLQELWWGINLYTPDEYVNTFSFTVEVPSGGGNDYGLMIPELATNTQRTLVDTDELLKVVTVTDSAVVSCSPTTTFTIKFTAELSAACTSPLSFHEKEFVVAYTNRCETSEFTFAETYQTVIHQEGIDTAIETTDL